MRNFLIKSFILAVVAAFSALAVSAQIPGVDNRREPLPDSIKERLVKLRIEDEKKEHARLLKRSEEVAELSEEIQTSYVKNKSLTSTDRKKLDRVERLLKKIRRELRAGKDKDADREKKPNSMNDALSNLRENTLKLYEEVKKTSRHSISVVAIQSSNAVWKLVKFIRFKK
ncbi:MAG: hypothetical protein HKN25_03470 [Pyrinomonadaceae bacterium]|nr:hypothetical protein [Pyrinomonadaceae bacterium]